MSKQITPEQLFEMILGKPQRTVYDPLVENPVFALVSPETQMGYATLANKINAFFGEPITSATDEAAFGSE